MCDGLVVLPGDVLALPVAPPSHLTPAQRDRLKEVVEEFFPGVRVAVVEGIAGGPFVYRPASSPGDPPAPTDG